MLTTAILFTGALMKKIALLYFFNYVIVSIYFADSQTINWETITKHLLPDGEAKNVADSIFKEELFHAYLNRLDNAREVFKDAGFEPLTKSYRISRHPLLPNFVFKLVRTAPDECHPSSTSSVIERVLQADMLRKLIKDLGLTHIVVPQKHLYQPHCLKMGLTDEHFVCFAQRLDILPIEENKKAIWGLPEETVQEVITLIKDNSRRNARNVAPIK